MRATQNVPNLRRSTPFLRPVAIDFAACCHCSAVSRNHEVISDQVAPVTLGDRVAWHDLIIAV